MTLLVNRTPAREGARSVTVKTVASEQGLRYLDWVKSRMALVDRLSGGKVGYIHLPDTALAGNRMLQKLFYSQAGKPALLIDDRYNGGGFIPDRMIEMLSRTTLAFWARRGRRRHEDARVRARRPEGDAHQRLLRVGRRRPPLLLPQGRARPARRDADVGRPDRPLRATPRSSTAAASTSRRSGSTTARERWVVENAGVAPDVEVFDLAEKRLDGGDPSLEKGVEILLEALSKRPGTEPKAPVPPRVGR